MIRLLLKQFRCWLCFYKVIKEVNTIVLLRLMRLWAKLIEEIEIESKWFDGWAIVTGTWFDDLLGFFSLNWWSSFWHWWLRKSGCSKSCSTSCHSSSRSTSCWWHSSTWSHSSSSSEWISSKRIILSSSSSYYSSTWRYPRTHIFRPCTSLSTKFLDEVHNALLVIAREQCLLLILLLSQCKCQPPHHGLIVSWISILDLLIYCLLNPDWQLNYLNSIMLRIFQAQEELTLGFDSSCGSSTWALIVVLWLLGILL